MTKYFWITILIFCNFAVLSQSGKNPLVCASASPWATDKPDTVQSFKLLSGDLSRAQLPDAKPVSNTGFKTPGFAVSWLAVSTLNIENYTARIAHKSSFRQVDTSSCDFLQQSHKAIIYQSKKGYIAIIFQKNIKEQDLFVMTAKNRRKLQKGLDYLTQNFTY